MQEVSPGIYALSGLKMGRSYLIDDRDGITLVDTSTATSSAGILRAVERLGRRVEDIRTVVATHYHYDHTGNVTAVEEQSGAQLWAHTEEAPYIDGRKPWKPGLPGFLRALGMKEAQQYSLRVDRELREGDVVPAAGGLEVLHAPGHTPGQIVLYSRERGVLFAGDSLMNVLGLREPARWFSHDMDAARRTIRRLANLDFEVALPGHGPPIIGRASEKVRMWVRGWLDYT
jgi:glyoxylase-like metal-dependent hydrolase (beta-lactamase superfamily II)